MNYPGSQHFDHSQPPRIGVLLINLGTPDAPESGPVRRYLKQFLWDPRVVEIPRLLWWLILHAAVLPLRPRRSAAAYRKIWTEQGSPLLLHTRAQAQALQQRMQSRHGEGLVVDYAMRYSKPAIADALQGMLDAGVRKLLVLPLYPQYSGPTTGSAFDALAADFTRRRWLPELRFVNHYHDKPAYIEAIADSIRRYRASHGTADKLLFSYHGEPRHFLDQGDPYHCQCHKTTRLVVEALGLNESDYLTTFQSRFGKAQWLQPYTDVTLRALPARGVHSVQVVCPGFSADCLETLEEIGVENRDYFLAAGGRDYAYIPALNSDAGHIEALAAIAEENLQGWLPLSSPAQDSLETQRRATSLGAKQ